MEPRLKSQKLPTREESFDDGDYKEYCRLYKAKVAEYLHALIDDINNHLPVNCYGAATRLKDLSTIHRRLDTEGLSFATLTLPKLWAGLSLYLETGQVLYPSFHLSGYSGHPVFLRGLFRLAYGNTEFKGKAIMLIYQISTMFSKLRGPYPDSVLSKQLADFVEVDRKLGDLDFESEALGPIAATARNEIENLFDGFDISRCVPRPGPGATNEPVEKHLRYRPHVLYTQIDDVMPYADWFYVNGYDVIHQTKIFVQAMKRCRKAPSARFKFVHKKVGKARGICIEENEMQFMQQAVKHGIYDWVEKHYLTKGKVNFSDQSVNARLALESSVNCHLATLDMSEASDRILRRLVLYLFSSTPLVELLDGLSTRRVTFPKLKGNTRLRSIELNKFAPMGSGLCFPIMSIVHWALLRAIIKHSMLPDAHCDEVYVYGDDIIVPIDTVQAVYDYLPLFGMKLNTDKSFYRSKFRESCGVHAYEGMDITPIYVKYLPNSTNITQAMSCIAVESEFYHKGFTNVARVFRENIGKYFPNLPITPITSSEFGFKRKGEFQPIRFTPVKTRIDAYGEPVCRVRVVSPVQTKDQPPTEYECYLRHVLTRANARFMGGTPFGFKTKWKFVGEPQLCGHQTPLLVQKFVPIKGDINEIAPKQENSSGPRARIEMIPQRKQGYPHLRSTMSVEEWLGVRITRRPIQTYTNRVVHPNDTVSGKRRLRNQTFKIWSRTVAALHDTCYQGVTANRGAS